MKVHTKRRRAGFSLTEMLVVVGIIAILLGIGVPSILYYQRELKLTELDDNARAVFIAAQNNLTALRSASAGELEVSDAVGRSAKDAGAASTLAGTALKYVSTDVSGAEPGWLVLPGSIESDLAEGSYLVEFEPKSGAVYGVFFLEKGTKTLDESTYGTICANSCRVREGRKAFSNASGGFYVGYYGADGALDMTRPDTLSLPKPKLTLINAEELVLKIDTDAASWPSTIDQTKVYASVTVSGPSPAGDPASKMLVSKGAIRSGAGGTVVLDTLKSSGYSQGDEQNTAGWTVGAPFAKWMDNGSGGYIITPGADITVTVSIWYDGEGMVALPQSVSMKNNSLFAARNGSGETVSVAYGRHLQNLDANTSRLDSGITAAVQMKKIDFGKTGDGVYSWADTYPGRKFNAINNANLDSYNGQSQMIQNMDAQGVGGPPHAGMFGRFSGSTLENIVLVDAKASGGAPTGALVGITDPGHDLVVENCQVYLTAPYSDAVRIKSGSQAGGLIGLATNKVTINNSFVSTVVEGGQVGGMVGRSKDIVVQNSYAASHLSGNQVGGMVGGLESNSASVTIRNSYAAGSIARATSEAAGMVVAHPGTTAATNHITIQNAYAAVDYGENVPTSDKVYGVAPVGSCTNVSYLAKAGVNDAVTVPNVTVFNSTEAMQTSAALGLGTPFIDGENAAVNAYPYNLVTRTAEEGPLEKPYPYPTLRVKIDETWVSVPHYGDWLEATPPTPMSLIAYYEQFSGVTEYSCHIGGAEQGQIKDAARTEAINADGYAFLSEIKLNEDWEGKTDLTVKTVGMETKETTVKGRFLGALDEEFNETADESLMTYYVYAIPTTALDVIPNSSCYNEVTVQGKGPQVQWDIPAPEAEVTAWVNPLFARAAYNGTKPIAAPDPIHVRSLRQLANVGRFFGARNYVQDLDIDASIYYGDLAFDKDGNSIVQSGMEVNADGHVTVAGFEIWGRGWDKTWDYATNIWSLPSEYRLLFTPIGQHDSPGGTEGGYDKVSSFNGVYDGNGRTIRALSIRSYSDGATNYAGLFYRTINGTLTNIHLTDCDVVGTTGGSSNAIGILAGRLSSKSQAINCTVKDCNVIAKGTKAGGHVGGLAGYVDRGVLTIQNCQVENCNVEGGEFARNVGGFVGYVRELKADGAIRDCTARNVTVSNRFNKGELKDSIEKIGSVGGFMGCYDIGNGSIDGCAVIGTGGLAVSGDTWNAGGFAGSVSKGTIQNCGVRLENPGKSGYAAQSVSGGKVSGGFVGTLLNSTVTQSYAAIKVDGATAGGFVGSLEGGELSNCYAAGHTQGGKYSSGRPNVTGTAYAGGFIGVWKEGNLAGPCYTTCAVSGTGDLSTDIFANQGATALGSPVTDCYALGTTFVNGAKRGTLNKANVAVTMPELGKDQRTATFPYDTTLTDGYPFRPVLGTDGSPMAHYGDWPHTVSGRPGFEWTPTLEEFEPADLTGLQSAEAHWTENGLKLTIDTIGSGTNLANLFNRSGGAFTVTSDLGEVLNLKAESTGGPGAVRITDSAGNVWEITPEIIGNTPDGQPIRSYSFTIPAASLPPYLKTLNLGGFKQGDMIDQITYQGKPEGFQPTEAFEPGDTVTVDGKFDDWNGYPHQILNHDPGEGNASSTNMGAAFGDGNLLYLHLHVARQANLVDPSTVGVITGLPVSNMSGTLTDVNGKEGVIWGGFSGNDGSSNYSGPGMYSWYAGGNSPSGDWLQVPGGGTAYIQVNSDGSQDMEMVIDLEKILGETVANTIVKFRADFGTLGGSLTIWRDPPKTED